MHFCGALQCIIMLLLLLFHYHTVSVYDVGNFVMRKSATKIRGECSGILQCLESGHLIILYSVYSGDMTNHSFHAGCHAKFFGPNQ